MTCFNFLKTYTKNENNERDQQAPQSNISFRDVLPKEESLITVHVPSDKSFKLFKYVHTHVKVGIPVTAMKPIRTNCYEGDGAWWSYCCFGCWCRTCAGLVINFKLEKNISLVFKYSVCERFFGD